VRCSTVERATDFLSLEAQESRIRSWAEAVGAEVIEVISDAGVSGAKPMADRAGGGRILSFLDARKPEVDAVGILRLDRLGRDAAETLGLLKRFRAGKVGLVSVADRLDLATPQGRAMAGVAAVFAELERSLIALRTKEALSERINQGKPWNHPPFGFDVEKGQLIPDEAEQAVLVRIASLRAEGVSYNKIANQLNARNVATKRGGPWYAASVRSVWLTNTKVANPASLYVTKA
jgi:site-specific DNA recombinase